MAWMPGLARRRPVLRPGRVLRSLVRLLRRPRHRRRAGPHRQTATPTEATAALGDTVHSRTRPYRPATNGKVERFNRTVLIQWADARAWSSDGQRTRALTAWLDVYNHHRHHTAIGGPPIGRVSDLTGQLVLSSLCSMLERFWVLMALPPQRCPLLDRGQCRQDRGHRLQRRQHPFGPSDGEQGIGHEDGCRQGPERKASTTAGQAHLFHPCAHLSSSLGLGTSGCSCYVPVPRTCCRIPAAPNHLDSPSTERHS